MLLDGVLPLFLVPIKLVLPRRGVGPHTTTICRGLKGAPLICCRAWPEVGPTGAVCCTGYHGHIVSAVSQQSRASAIGEVASRAVQAGGGGRGRLVLVDKTGGADSSFKILPSRTPSAVSQEG